MKNAISWKSFFRRKWNFLSKLNLLKIINWKLLKFLFLRLWESGLKSYFYGYFLKEPAQLTRTCGEDVVAPSFCLSQWYERYFSNKTISNKLHTIGKSPQHLKLISNKTLSDVSQFQWYISMILHNDIVATSQRYIATMSHSYFPKSS